MKSKISPSGLTPQSGSPILGTILTLRGHCQCLKTFWMSQLGEGGCCCKYLAESSRVAAKHCAMHRMAPMTRNYSAQSVLCASVERPWPGVTTTSYALHILPENLKYIFFTNFCLHNWTVFLLICNLLFFHLTTSWLFFYIDTYNLLHCF